MRGLRWMVVILSVCFCSGVAWAEKPRTVEVWRNLFTVTHGEGVNSNSTFLVTKEGVVVVDTRVTPAEAEKVKEAIRKQTDLPVLYTINTHYHGDHTFGNQVFKDSHTIIAHENVRKALEFEAGKDHLEVFKSRNIPGMEETVVTPPNLIFRERMDLYVGAYHLQLIHVKGHTDGDLFIYIEALKTLITGDLIQNRRIPYMGDAYIEEWIKSINYLGDLDAEIYIPGHGDPGGKPVLIAMKHYLIDLTRNVKVQIEKGSSLQETLDAVLPKLKAKYGSWDKQEWLDDNIKKA
ncbi:MAG: MBL fold metallo-hydrolase, partial [Nitrospinota bacterium]